MVQSYSPGGGNVSSHEGTLAPPGEYDWTCASLGPMESTTQTANRSLKRFLHSSRQIVPILYNGRPYPSELPLQMGIWTPCNTWCLGPMRADNPNGTSISWAMFTQMTADCPYTLQWFAHFWFKIAPFHGGSGPHGSLGPPESWTQMATRSLQPFCTAHKCDRLTDRATQSVAYSVIGRMYVWSNSA